LDEGRHVQGDGVVEVFGKVLLQLLHLGDDAVGDGDGVGFRQRPDGETAVGPAVELAGGVRIAGAEGRMADVLEANLPAVAVAAQDDLFELFDVVQSAQRRDGELEGLARGGRWLADVTGGHLAVLLADGVDHVCGGQGEGRPPFRGHPDAHAFVFLAGKVYVADARHAPQLVRNLDGGVVAEVELAVAPPGRIDADDLQDVRVALAGGDADLLDHFGQERQGQVDAVLHEHLGEVQVDPRLEGD